MAAVLSYPEERIIAALRQAALFSPLNGEDLFAVADSSRAYGYPKGQTVFACGEKGGALFVICEGAVAIKAGGDGSTIATFAAGETFGEMDLMDAEERNAEAVADSDAVLIRFPRRGLGFEGFQKRHPAAAAGLLKELLKEVSGRIRSANALVKENSPWVQELRRQAYADKLTGLYNKAFLEERMAELCAEGKGPASILMFKPDNFKEINDTYGHEAGDEVLKLVAEALRRTYGDEQPTARYLGNEMAVILPGADRRAAEETARNLLTLMGELDLSPVTGGNAMRLSVSIGCAAFPEHGAAGLDVIAAAHELPLLGRARGGNRVLFPEDKQ